MLVGLLPTLAIAGCVKRNPAFMGDAGETGDTGTPSSSSTAATPGSSGSTPSTSTTSGGPDDTTTSGSEACAPVLSSLELTVFTLGCTAADCHSGDAPAAALDLTNVDLFDHLLDVPSSTCLDWRRVVAGEAEQSILYAKVAGLATCDVVDPIAHDPLPDDELECLRQWISSIQACERCGGTECIDLSADASHCGACDSPCPAGIACTGSTCDCPNDGIACDGACVDPTSDSAHCGGCGIDCEGAPCVASECQCVGLTSCSDGCVDVMTDPLHCGDCDQPCDPGEECIDGICECSTTPLSFDTDVQSIFTAHCASNGCHGGPSPKEDMSLEVGEAHANLVGVEANQCVDGRLRVDPGTPDDSYLIHKLTAVDICAGVQMPSVGGPSGDLDADQIATIAAWICQGAIDN